MNYMCALSLMLAVCTAHDVYLVDYAIGICQHPTIPKLKKKKKTTNK